MNAAERTLASPAAEARTFESARRKLASTDWPGGLTTRPYVEDAKFTAAAEYSVRIEHAGESFYFPLGTHDARFAAAKAADIQAMVINQGWAVAKRIFPREITTAFFWTLSPLTCTYTSLYSIPANIPDRWRQHPPSAQKFCRTVIIEAEEAVRKALAFWVDRQPGFFCTGEFASVSEALGATQMGRTDLLLVNRGLMEQPGGAPLNWIRKQFPAVNTFGFGIYEESNYIFHSVTGVKSGYILCRRPPGCIFEPIRSLAGNPRLPHASLETEIQDCFQSLFAGQKNGSGEKPSAKLTPREHEVLKALAKGLSEKQVAATLRISALTVHNHVKNIYAKIDAHSRTEAVMKYLGR